jgi:hypothetical protein
MAVTPRRGKIPKIMATFVYASSQGQRMHSAQTKISAGADGGPCSRVCERAHLPLSSAFYQYQRKNFNAHVGGGEGEAQNSKHFLKKKNDAISGNFFFSSKSNF